MVLQQHTPGSMHPHSRFRRFRSPSNSSRAVAYMQSFASFTLLVPKLYPKAVFMTQSPFDMLLTDVQWADDLAPLIEAGRALQSAVWVGRNPQAVTGAPNPP
jgi:hypothetical protein